MLCYLGMYSALHETFKGCAARLTNFAVLCELLANLATVCECLSSLLHVLS